MIFMCAHLMYYFINIVIFDVCFYQNRIGGVMVSVLASSAIHRGFNPMTEQTKDYAINFCCFSTKHAS